MIGNKSPRDQIDENLPRRLTDPASQTSTTRAPSWMGKLQHQLLLVRPLLWWQLEHLPDQHLLRLLEAQTRGNSSKNRKEFGFRTDRCWEVWTFLIFHWWCDPRQLWCGDLGIQWWTIYEIGDKIRGAGKNFCGCSGFLPGENRSVKTGFNGKYIITFRTKKTFNLDERLAGKESFTYKNGSETVTCSVKGIRVIRDPELAKMKYVKIEERISKSARKSSLRRWTPLEQWKRKSRKKQKKSNWRSMNRVHRSVQRLSVPLSKLKSVRESSRWESSSTKSLHNFFQLGEKEWRSTTKE